MRMVGALCLSLLVLAACGGKKPAPVDASPPAEDTAKAAEDTAKAPEPDAAKAAEPDAAKAPEPDAAKAPDDAAKAPDDAAAAADKELIARGEYVAGLAGCPLCHTAMGPKGPMLDKMWAGGLEIPESFGTWRSTNITQDKKTGIGGWTDAEIIAAVREGKRPDGTVLYPIMPYPFYNVMSDGDAKALVAFLRTIPPIENAVAGNTDLKLPKTAMPAAKGAEPEADPVKRGGYLAAIMHCGACHTPMGPEGPEMAKFLAGNPEGFEIPFLGEGKLYASNITPHEATGIGSWSADDIKAALKELKRKDGSKIIGPMEMYVMGGWAKLSDKDLDDIAAYLKSVPAVELAIPKSTFKPHGPPPDAPPAADAGAAPDKGDAAP